MRIVILNLILISILCSNCAKKIKNETSSKINLKKGTIVINIDSISMNFYTNFHTKKNLMYGYNDITHNIDIFDLKEKKLKGHINIEILGPDGIGSDVRGLYYHNHDSIFIVTENSLFIVNDKGSVAFKINLHSMFRNKHSFDPIVNDNFRLKYFEESKEIFIENLYPTGKIRDFIENPLVSIINLDSKKAEFSPIIFSNVFKKRKGYVGFLRWMNFESFKNDSLFFNSQFDDELIIYDKKTKKISYTNLEKRRKIDRLNPKSNSQNWVSHAIENTHRFAIIYDKWRNIYYRFLWKGIRVKRSDNYFNSLMDKPLILEIYNAKFELITANEFENNLYRINTWFVNEEGLYLSPTHPKSKQNDADLLEFDIFKVTGI